MRPSPSIAVLAGLTLALATGFVPGLAAQTLPEAPNAVSLEPPHLATGLVAARVSRLVVRFDQDMEPSTNGLEGMRSAALRVYRTYWTDARTFVADVELRPDHVYALDLGFVPGLRGANGAGLRPAVWRFATAGERLADGVAAVAMQRLFTALRDHYSYRDRIGVDWNEVEQQTADALHAAADAPAFALLAADLLGAAQDPHITVRWQDDTLPTYHRSVIANFDRRGILKTFPRPERVGRNGLAARAEDGVGYLLVPSFAREERDDFDRLLQALRGMLDCRALVLDLRINEGGDETLARRLAAFFVPDEVVFAKHRVRDPKADGGFRRIESRTLRGNGPPDTYRGPVAVLMGQANMASAEDFLLMMKQAPMALLVGADSYGSSGNPLPHTLLPGLVVQIPNWQALRPDGAQIEGLGVSAHLHVDARADQLVDDDPVLQAALSRLRKH